MRLLLVDDHNLFRQGLRQLLEAKLESPEISEAGSGAEAIRLAGQFRPDVILLDINLPDITGIQAARQILEKDPAARIIILTMHRQDEHLFEAIKVGARGYLLKDVDWQMLVDAVQAVLRGEVIIDRSVSGRVLDEFRRLSQAAAQPAPSDTLSQTEHDILVLLAQGLENQAIAEQLFISEKTVTNRLSDIYRKLGVSNRTQAALYALRQGWTKLSHKPQS